jgi:hypothetical protein
MATFASELECFCNIKKTPVDRLSKTQQHSKSVHSTHPWTSNKQHLFHKKHYRGNGNRQSGTLLDIVESQEHFLIASASAISLGLMTMVRSKAVLFLMAWRTLRHRDCMRSCGRFLFARPTSRTSVAEQRPQPSQSGRFCFQKFLLCNLWAIRTR